MYKKQMSQIFLVSIKCDYTHLFLKLIAGIVNLTYK